MEKEDTMIDGFMKANNWHVADRLMLPSRKGRYFPFDDLQLSPESANFLKSSFSSGIYGHQKEAI